MINHSGGCPGADMVWENEGLKYGVETVAYSFPGHTHDSKTPHELTGEELTEGFEHVKIADRTLKKNVDTLTFPYIRKLLARDWFQVKNSEALFAIGSFLNSARTQVNGGTGWTCQMGIDNNKPVFLFDQPTSEWYVWNADMKKFESTKGHTPILTGHFGGIGSRAIKPNGIQAVKDILLHNLGT